MDIVLTTVRTSVIITMVPLLVVMFILQYFQSEINLFCTDLLIFYYFSLYEGIKTSLL